MCVDSSRGVGGHRWRPSRAEPGQRTSVRQTRYPQALDRHNEAIQQAYDRAQESLANLRRVYAGAAAEDFLSQWDRTTEALERYLQGARDIKEILEARLATLRQADRPGGAG